MADRTTVPTTTTESGLDRRSVLKGLAIAGAAVPILAACGSKGSDSTKTPPGGTGGGGSTTTPGGGGSSTPPSGGADILVAASKVPVGGGVILPGARTVVTQPTKGTFEGFSSTCTHLGCTVATIADGKIICPCHGSMYSVATGAVVGGPAPLPLPKKPVKLDGANIVAG